MNTNTQYRNGDTIHRANRAYIIRSIDDTHVRASDENGKLHQFQIKRLERELQRGWTSIEKAAR